MTTPPAFFSYSRVDEVLVLRIADELKKAGANVWVDQLDIRPGQPSAPALMVQSTRKLEKWDSEVERVLTEYRAQARHWYEEAAAAGSANAMYSLGKLYEKGIGKS
jgi:TPR repeat protein